LRCFLTCTCQVKCRRQVDAKLYKSTTEAWGKIYSKEGLRGVFFGWTPTFVGYSLQGAGKYGFYEVFKHIYGDRLAPNMNQTVVFLAASASAEFLADIALCPLEAVKVRMQTTLPPFAHTLREGFSKVVQQEGYAGLYKGIFPLWGRQIPYTMVKFATFEETVKQIYKTLGKPKDQFSGLQQTGVSFLGGYIAGIGCAVVSHPAGMLILHREEDGMLTRCRCHGLKTQRRSQGWRGCRSSSLKDIREHWLPRFVERSSRPYFHDRNTHRTFYPCSSVTHNWTIRIANRIMQAFQWLIYDSFKVYLGVSTFLGLPHNQAALEHFEADDAMSSSYQPPADTKSAGRQGTCTVDKARRVHGRRF
jgi:hypothetical protein